MLGFPRTQPAQIALLAGKLPLGRRMVMHLVWKGTDVARVICIVEETAQDPMMRQLRVHANHCAMMHCLSAAEES